MREHAHGPVDPHGEDGSATVTREPSPLRRATPLRRRLFVLTAAAIAPLAIMAALGLYALQRQQAEQAERVGLELSRSVANGVDAELRSTIEVLEALATSLTIERADLPGFRERAKRVLLVTPEWSAIVLANRDGASLVDTRAADDERLPLLEPESFDRVVRTKAPATGDLYMDPRGRWLFPVRVPVLVGAQVEYVLSALVTPDAIRDVLVRQRVPADWVISIVDSRNVRIARSRAHEETLGGGLSATVQQVVDSSRTEGFGIAYALEGERIFTPYSRLPNGWTAVLGFPTALADAAAYRALTIYGGGVLLSIAIGALCALWIARTIARPMADLRAAAEALGRRQRPRTPDTSIQEIREVAAALAAAAADLASGEAEREALLRNERVAREAAEAADRAKDEFMAVLSHELRTPLNAVYGWARMLQSGQLRDAATAERAKNAIVRNADVQMQLIDDLLDLSRISTGKLRLAVTRVEVAQVLHAAVDAVRPAADAKRIAIHTSAESGVPSIAGDSGRLQQVVWNLLMNAVKFTPKGGHVHLRLASADDSVRIVVSDNGQGIAPALLPFVFERFRQADSSSTRSHGGLGLGLALVKHLVELHGGTVLAESPGPGEGATFTVALPVGRFEVSESTSPQELPASPAGAVGTRVAPLDGVRALVVDDDGEGLALTETILRQAGAEVRTCSSAEAALDMVRRWRPDVVVSDVEMPGEDGYSLIRRVRALSPEEGSATPAIALTAYGRPQDRDRSLAAGFSMHVPKPVDPGELTAIVAGLVDLRPEPSGRRAHAR